MKRLLGSIQKENVSSSHLKHFDWLIKHFQPIRVLKINIVSNYTENYLDQAS